MDFFKFYGCLTLIFTHNGFFDVFHALNLENFEAIILCGHTRDVLGPTNPQAWLRLGLGL